MLRLLSGLFFLLGGLSALTVASAEDAITTGNPDIGVFLLSPHALPEETSVEEPRLYDAIPGYRRSDPLYKSLIYLPRNDSSTPPGIATARPFSPTFAQPQGLFPQEDKAGLSKLKFGAAVSQTYESNVLLSRNNPIGDLYTTTQVQAEHQLGTPDSPYLTDGYETIFAAQSSARFFQDIFWRHQEFNSTNYEARLNTRIGRDQAIWRPFISRTDINSSSTLTFDRASRIRRQTLTSGVTGEYDLSPYLSYSHGFTHIAFQHTQPIYINLQSFRYQQEVATKISRDMSLLWWSEYRQTNPSRGDRADEIGSGFGWRGNVTDRLFSKLSIGWSNIEQERSSSRQDMSGLRVNGTTSLNYSQRLRLTMNCFREYNFNEIDLNDNYVASGGQIYALFYLGGNWYVTPYLALTHLDFESSREIVFQYRPELEISYAFNELSRCYVKGGYEMSESLSRTKSEVESMRLSVGIAYQF